ncbi:MAG: hypothetical protein JWQ38_395 [Flavipsychrobacter sp.]|nr:hypothetical protein [Flavipsychrobacter sp.]
MEVNNNTAETIISIQGINELTDDMLQRSLSGGQTLDSFLATQCTALARGAFSVYETKNYVPFSSLAENRLVNEAHVQALMESFVNDGYLFTILYVNEKLEIIDGQHRFEAAKRSSLPVYFMVMPGWGIREVTILNVNSRNWTIEDFMETHAKAGNPNYVRFKEFFDANEFDVSVCQILIMGRRSGGNATTDTFRLGQSQIDDQQITDAWVKVKKISELKQFHPKGWKSRNFIEAVLTLLKTKDYDHEHMIMKLSLYPEFLLAESKSLRVDEYLQIFLDKYNFRRQKDKIEIKRR